MIDYDEGLVAKFVRGELVRFDPVIRMRSFECQLVL